MATMTMTETASTSNEKSAKLSSLTTTTTITKENQLRPLHCIAQQYEWGRLGSSSTVARMKEAQVSQANNGEEDGDDDDDDDEFEVEEMEPYAELWLGTHPSGMSQVTLNPQDNRSLKSLLHYVQTNPMLHCGNAFATDLSFLLKILSVRKVLSIQAHPDKTLAQQLHVERPHIYKDPNHKPEMAIALSDQVRAMCGFRPISEISRHLDEYPEFKSLLGPDTAAALLQLNHSIIQTTPSDADDAAAANTRSVLQKLFRGYIAAEPHVIQCHVEQMVARLRALEGRHNDLQKLILQLEEQFPNDCGIFAPLIFNICTMTKGEALFIAANEPHAYVSGEIIECMACSDNVVRAGLTPKLKDIPTLVEMLTYQTGLPQTTFGEKVDECTTRYVPPVEDFCIETIYVPAYTVYELGIVSSPCVVLTMEGEGTLKQELNGGGSDEDVVRLSVSFGLAAFLSASTACSVEAGPYGIRLTRAFNNVYFQTQA